MPELYTLDRLKAHVIYRNAEGKRIPGVTTVLGMLNKPALVKWANELGLQGISYDKALSHAADIGTVAHAMCEAHLRGMDFDESNIPPDVLDKAANGYIRFTDWWRDSGYKVVANEVVMVSEQWQCGGTADIIAESPDGKLHLLDIKTSKAVYREMSIQVSAYAEMYPAYISEVHIVRIGKEEAGDVEVVKVSDADRALCLKVFGKLCEIYPLLGQLRRK